MWRGCVRCSPCRTGPTVVGGHSYGGQIMTALGTDAPNVVALVYVAAFGLDEGESEIANEGDCGGQPHVFSATWDPHRARS
jgi:pimeloyl-ACP methyl ester carboxylesterase